MNKLLLLCCVLVTSLVAADKSISLTPAEAAKLVSDGKAVLVDVREPSEWAESGVATPAGSSVNILGIQFIEEYGKVRVPFLTWTAIGIPMVLLLLPVAYWAVLRFSPPEQRLPGTLAAGVGLVVAAVLVLVLR